MVIFHPTHFYEVLIKKRQRTRISYETTFFKAFRFRFLQGNTRNTFESVLHNASHELRRHRGKCLNTTMIMTFFDRNPYTETCIYHLASWGVKIQGLLCYKKIFVQIAGIDLEKNAILDGILLRYFL